MNTGHGVENRQHNAEQRVNEGESVQVHCNVAFEVRESRLNHVLEAHMRRPTGVLSFSGSVVVELGILFNEIMGEILRFATIVS